MKWEEIRTDGQSTDGLYKDRVASSKGQSPRTGSISLISCSPWWSTVHLNELGLVSSTFNRQAASHACRACGGQVAILVRDLVHGRPMEYTADRARLISR